MEHGSIWILVAIVGAFGLLLSRKRFRNAFYRWAEYKLSVPIILSLLLAFLVALAFVMGYRIQFVTPTWDISTGTGLWKSICLLIEQFEDASVYGVGTVFGILEGDVEELRNAYPNYRFVTWLLCVGIPALTVSTALAVLLNFFPHPLCSKEEYLVFSHVEENSILLAEDMMTDHKNKEGILRKDRIVIFLRTKEDVLTPEYETRLKRIRAKVYPYTEADLLRIHWRIRRKKLRFFFLSSDTELNFNRMDTLLRETERENLFGRIPAKSEEAVESEEQNGVFRQELYLLSETSSAPLLIDNLRQKLCQERADEKGSYVRRPVFAHTDLRLLDRYRTIMYNLLQEKPLYESSRNKKIRVLILGFGRVGKAFFRAAKSFCAMAGYETSFCIRDLEIDRQWGELLLECPLCDEEDKVDRGSVNVQSEEVLKLINEKIDQNEQFTYIVLSLGDDERNITVASRLVRHYIKMCWENPSTLMPTICVNLENVIKSDYVSKFFKHDTSEIMLHVFGTDNKTFSEEMLINRNLWRAARMLHKGLKEKKVYDFSYWSEYERRSSVASVAHASYHVKALGVDLDIKGYERKYQKLESADKEAMIDAEHRRWRSYSCCEGMQGISEKTAKKILRKKWNHVDTIAGLTPCMVDTKELQGLFRRLYRENTNLPQGMEIPNRTFYERDRYVVSNACRLAEIIDGGDDSLVLKEFEAGTTQRKR